VQQLATRRDIQRIEEQLEARSRQLTLMFAFGAIALAVVMSL